MRQQFRNNKNQLILPGIQVINDPVGAERRLTIFMQSYFV